MHVDNALRSSPPVKVVHVLRAKEEAFAQLVFELSQCEVRRVGLRSRSYSPTHGVELPDQPGVAAPRIGRGDLLDPVVPPETVDTPECRYPALGAYARPCQDEKAIMWRNGEHESSVVRSRRCGKVGDVLAVGHAQRPIQPGVLRTMGFFAN